LGLKEKYKKLGINNQMNKNKLRTLAGLKLITEEKHEDKKKPDIKNVIQSLISAKASDDNEDQGKIVQLLRGIAFSNDPKSDAFMKKLTSMISQENFGNLTK
jgi:hypothetical protein